jgi:hypothetical protein
LFGLWFFVYFLSSNLFLFDCFSTFSFILYFTVKNIYSPVILLSCISTPFLPTIHSLPFPTSTPIILNYQSLYLLTSVKLPDHPCRNQNIITIITLLERQIRASIVPYSFKYSFMA